MKLEVFPKQLDRIRKGNFHSRFCFDDCIVTLAGYVKRSYELMYSNSWNFAYNFRAIGIDLICNLPYSDLSTTISDINIASKMNINHIALYPLRIEPNSIFYNSYSKYEDGFLIIITQLIFLLVPLSI